MMLPVYHHPCGRREVVVGKWGHMLAHPSNCPECQTPNPNSHLGRAIAEARQRIEDAVAKAPRIPASIKKERQS